MSRELFERAIETVLAHEGCSYSCHPADSGGATKYGIAQRWHPDVDVAALTREQAIEIYRREYWDGQGYDNLPAGIAVKVFDLAVNMGKRDSIVCLQRALEASGMPVTNDGVLGPKTYAAVAHVEQGALLAALRSEAAGAYRLIVEQDKGQMVFLRGWLKRAYS